ncbi:MAG: hypothetical protein LBS50_00655 [Prevotellaceae bacterium]|jgi:hypothetical protein|nr:hypothetical protein [Prevotellaceae bacterium]
MKKLSIFIISGLILFSCGIKNLTEIKEKLKNPKSLCLYNDGILISNTFGNSEIGYFSLLKNRKNEELISGTVIAAATAIKNNYFFAANYDKITVYNLNDAKIVTEISIDIPTDSIMDYVEISDLLVAGGTLFISTEIGIIYLLNIENPENIDKNTLFPYVTTIKNPSAMLMIDYHLFIGSSSENADENGLYMIDDLSNPAPRKMFFDDAQIYSMILSKDKTKIIFTDFLQNGKLGFYTFETNEVTYKTVADTTSTLGDLLYYQDKLYVCDSANDRILILEE